MTLPRSRMVLPALAAALLLSGSVRAADATKGLKSGTPELKSAGALAFGPDGILFVGDPQGATIFAIDTNDHAAPTSTDRPKVENLDEKIASLLGIEAKQVRINDMAVNPISGNTYLSVSRGLGASATPVLLRVARDGKISEFPLKDVKFASVKLSNAAEGGKRQEAITHLAYVKGRLFVAGLSNEEFASKLRSIPYPFTKTDKGVSVEIFHGAHGGLETKSPVRTFVPYMVEGKENLLAAYTCTPLVQFPVADLKPGEKVRGKTVAELGNRNRPLDMIVYKKGGKDYLLMANSSRGVMKIPLKGVESVEGITERIKGKAGLKYETIASLKGVMQLDRFDKDHALILVRGGGGAMTLETIELP